MTNYKELVEKLRRAADGYIALTKTMERGRTKNFFQASLDCKEAADAIENQQTHIAALMHQLAMARGERDAVTKRMIELEQEFGRVKEEPGV